MPWTPSSPHLVVVRVPTEPILCWCRCPVTCAGAAIPVRPCGPARLLEEALAASPPELPEDPIPVYGTSAPLAAAEKLQRASKAAAAMAKQRTSDHAIEGKAELAVSLQPLSADARVAASPISRASTPRAGGHHRRRSLPPSGSGSSRLRALTPVSRRARHRHRARAEAVLPRPSIP